MSLIAHYPLTDNVNDYSGNKRHLNNNGLTALENGKIGKAFRFTGTNYANRSEYVLCKTMSFSAWVNADNTTEDMTILKLDQSAMGMGYVNNTFRVWVWDGVSTAGDQAFCTETQTKTWNHFVGTYDGNELKLYKNGELVSTAKCSQKPRTDGSKFITIGCRESVTFPFKGLINDVRIYDHVLSKKEVKELSKAKIVHYDFNVPQYSTVNVLNNSNLDTAWQKGYCTSLKWNDIAPPEGIDSQVVSFIDNYTSTEGDNKAAYWYCYEDYCLKTPNTTYTVSMYIKTNDSNFRIKFYTADNTEAADGVSRYNSEYITVPNDGQWHRVVWAPFKNHASSVSKSLSFHFYFGNSGGESQRTWFCAPQCEEGEMATPFVPTGEKPSFVVKDKAGYGFQTDIITNSIAPKWKYSDLVGGYYEFTTGKGLYGPMATNPTEELTLSSWVYINEYANDNSNHNIILQKSANFYLCVGMKGSAEEGKVCAYWYGKSPAGYHSSNTKLALETWYHIAAVWSKTDLKLYINGVLDKTIAVTGTGVMNDVRLNVGAEHLTTTGGIVRHFHGCIADARVYATALSANDMLELYQVKQAISKDGVAFFDNIEVNPSTNLVINGDLELKDATNFPGSTYIAGDGSENGCIEIKGAYTFLSSDYIPVTPEDTYELFVRLKSCGTTLSNSYVGVGCYDANKNLISVSNSYNISSCRTTLATAINNGDTTVTLTSGTGWSNDQPGVVLHYKELGIFDKLNYNNYETPRIRVPYLSISGNVLTLKDPWSGGTIPAGTKVSRCSSGSTFSYALKAGGSTPNTWTNYTATMTGYTNGDYSENKFRPGTKYVRFLILANYQQTASEVMRVTNMRIVNKSKLQTRHYNNFKMQSSGQLKCSDVSTVGITDDLIAFYPLKNNKDYSGNSYDMEQYSSLPIPAINNGLTFTGTQAYNIKNILTYLRKDLRSYSVSIHFKTGSSVTALQRLAMGHPANRFEISISGGNISSTIHNGTAYIGVVSNVQVVPNTEYHYVLTYDRATAKAITYLNGAKTAEVSVAYFVEATDLLIGNWTSGGQGFIGEIYSLKIFERALNADEVGIENNSFINNQTAVSKNGVIYINDINETLL